METLKDYIKKYYDNIIVTKDSKDSISSCKLPDKDGLRTFEEMMDLNDILVEDPQLLDLYYQYNFNEYQIEESEKVGFINNFDRSKEDWLNNIYETLTSHSFSKLIKKINNDLGDYIKRFEYDKNVDSKSKRIVIYFDNKKDILDKFITISSFTDNFLKYTEESNKLYDILDFFNYYITEINANKENNEVYMIIEPMYTKNIYDDIKENCNGILYHITKKENIDKIKKGGLRPKVGKTVKEGGYRYFPEKVFLLGKSDNYKEELERLIKTKNFKDGEYSIIEIDLSKHNFGLWIDDAVTGYKYPVYTFEAIHQSLFNNIYENITDII